MQAPQEVLGAATGEPSSALALSRLDKARSEAFVRTAKALLDAGVGATYHGVGEKK